jgi:3-deoxy-D-manno-octulosonic-acid transferase
MRLALDLVYFAVASVTSPVWLVRMIRTGKIRTDWRGRLGRTPVLPAKTRPRLLIHAVSVGEVNAVRMLVETLVASTKSIEIVIATTTDTGFARASELWRDRFPVVRYPFDFSRSVRRFLQSVQPDGVALVELEVWPNFTAACHRAGIPVCVINGRLTARSFQRYQKVKPLVLPSFRRLAQVGAQNAEYAQRFGAMGVPQDRITITGTMKWDTAQIADEVVGADELAREMGIDRSRPVVVAGSTAPGEHELLMRALPPGAQLLCAPRKPEWFEQAARALGNCVRRSQPNTRENASEGRFLLDTIGELRKAYALATVVVIGRSFGNLHGSDMMEPIALGKATIVGPAIDDFRETVAELKAGDGIVQCTPEHLPQALKQLLENESRRAQLAANGRSVIRTHQGATARSAAIIESILSNSLVAAK